MMQSRGNFIDGQWAAGHAAAMTRHDPAGGRLTWQGHAADAGEVGRAIAAAGRSAAAWARLTAEQRAEYLQAFGKALATHAAELLEAICLETGKPRWEAKTELDALHNKIDLTRRALTQRRAAAASVSGDLTSAIRYRPLGVAAVLGPFNLPAHLPNGHILPALLAANTVVFKPSELTPGVGELYALCWQEAGLPPGVFNMVQGGREVGAALAAHDDVNAVLFTGSRAAGVAISRAVAGQPEKLLALEMGGNNPLIATRIADADAAIYAILQSAFITAGQRCTCARRLILLRDAEGDRLLDRLIAAAGKIRVGPFSLAPEPFMGPVISPHAADKLEAAFSDLAHHGATPLLPLRRLNNSAGQPSALLTPAILDVTAVANRPDEELFGPILQVIRATDFDAALAEANRTRYGLAAALLSDDPALYERFRNEVRAGIINWNRPTTGASSSLPFGGISASGNHRPAGFFAIDACADPVASLESPSLKLAPSLLPGITL